MEFQQIGSVHENKMAVLLISFGISFVRQEPIPTLHGAFLKIDFWLPPNEKRPPVILEC